MRQLISNEELLKLYDMIFDSTAEDPNSKAGKAHLKGLKAIYQKGSDDRGAWDARKNS